MAENRELNVKQLDYRNALAMQLMRLGRLSGSIKTSGSAASFYFASEVLESMLKPFIDEEYKNEKEKNITEIKAAAEKKDSTKLLTWQWDTKTKEPLYLEYGLAIMECCVELMARKNLLVSESVETEILLDDENEIEEPGN